MTGRTIVISGSSRGLGKALAETLAGKGHTVAGCGRSSSTAHLLEGELPPMHYRALDICSEAAVQDWSKQVLKDCGPPDILVNNAAVITEPARLWELPAEQFDHLIDVNIKGTANLIRAFLPAMLERARGIIVNFSSGWGRSVDSKVAPYCASKWAIEGLTKALALELPKGMAAVPLNPGIINTEMLQACFGDAAQSYPGPEEWAERAAPFILRLGPKDNGKSLTVE